MPKKQTKNNKLSTSVVLQRIDKLRKDYESSSNTGQPALLYTDKRFQDIFAKAVMEHGTNGSKIHQEIKKAKYDITCKTVHGYLRRLFGGYERKGRPSKYMQNERGRKINKK